MESKQIILTFIRACNAPTIGFPRTLRSLVAFVENKPCVLAHNYNFCNIRPTNNILVVHHMSTKTKDFPD